MAMEYARKELINQGYTLRDILPGRNGIISKFDVHTWLKSILFQEDMCDENGTPTGKKSGSISTDSFESVISWQYVEMVRDWLEDSLDIYLPEADQDQNVFNFLL